MDGGRGLRPVASGCARFPQVLEIVMRAGSASGCVRFQQVLECKGAFGSRSVARANPSIPPQRPRARGGPFEFPSPGAGVLQIFNFVVIRQQADRGQHEQAQP
jgi:hypothetical protein